MDREFLTDLFADFGPVTIRPMFSGFGISVDGVNFALALRAGLYFRADEATIPQFEAEGSKPFQYQTRAKTVLVNSYWQLPARLFDDTEELGQWATAALGAAQRAALKKRARARKRVSKPAAAKAAPRKRVAKMKSAKAKSRRVGKATRPPKPGERRRKRAHRSSRRSR
ncbi:MAG TPA: TfoX/Sxy family protein [Bradyrhizobium sp.]|uniref:TfoX/Sxy family protein n=1 Tax=Bradyrhizobium sp. TaxID=376 RepID=UPI002B57CE63|nr:TfoX/Sxy family protein [Bradyrhizobium sp.]HLZ03700.1 TfoX/Sxy family protein [Bradyrhizobium sp.]